MGLDCIYGPIGPCGNEHVSALAYECMCVFKDAFNCIRQLPAENCRKHAQKTWKLWEILSVQSRNHGQRLTSTRGHKHGLDGRLKKFTGTVVCLLWWPDLSRAKQIITVIAVFGKDAGRPRGYNGRGRPGFHCDHLLLKLSASLASHKESTGTAGNGNSRVANVNMIQPFFSEKVLVKPHRK